MDETSFLEMQTRLRKEYRSRALDESSVNRDPLAQFSQWFGEAVNANEHEPNAMVLATVSPGGRPAARMVLLKDTREGEFVFFTHYSSKKGHEMAANSRVALLFYWPVCERQIRIEGTVRITDSEESDRYFAQRPRAAQLGASVSPQSEVLESREMLEKHYAAASQQYANSLVPRPQTWGGYAVQPEYFEFWQGRESRLHDRIAFRKSALPASWEIVRLAP